MLNQLSKSILIFTGCIALVACHKPPVLDKELALSLLNASGEVEGYSVSIVTNNPNARGTDASGWTCTDKKDIIDADIVQCKNSGRSGVYLTFTDAGKDLLVGQPWGDYKLRNARVIAVKQAITSIESIQMTSKKEATVTFSTVYSEHTPFASAYLQQLMPLNIPKIRQLTFRLVGKEWGIK